MAKPTKTFHEAKDVFAHVDGAECVCCPDRAMTCPECRGERMIEPMVMKKYAQKVQCPICAGRGLVENDGEAPILWVHREIVP